jgi:hypothetical protein
MDNVQKVCHFKNLETMCFVVWSVHGQQAAIWPPQEARKTNEVGRCYMVQSMLCVRSTGNILASENCRLLESESERRRALPSAAALLASGSTRRTAIFIIVAVRSRTLTYWVLVLICMYPTQLTEHTDVTVPSLFCLWIYIYRLHKANYSTECMLSSEDSFEEASHLIWTRIYSLIDVSWVHNTDQTNKTGSSPEGNGTTSQCYRGTRIKRNPFLGWEILKIES